MAKRILIVDDDVCDSKTLEDILANEQGVTEVVETSTTLELLQYDRLTGIYTREAFLALAESMLNKHESGYYVMSCFDIDSFKVINDQYGNTIGDKVLKHVAECINRCVSTLSGICCRVNADDFAILYPSCYLESDIVTDCLGNVLNPQCINRSIRIRIGRYVVDDLSIPVSVMFDRAIIACESIRGRYDTYIALYDDSMRASLIHEQKIVNDMYEALRCGEFEPWFQPQFNHGTGAMIGAEALARWKKDGAFISPSEFIPVFERNGFIYEMDLCIWEKTCIHLREWIDKGYEPLPISVNISRCDIFHDNFIDKLTGIVDKYELPYELVRLEVTESALSESTNMIVEKVIKLINLGFTIEIDDFGSGYSSLNTLKDVPASILKLDMKFFENTTNSVRSGNIIESIVRMAKWLGMAVIAEGVEEIELADYLRSIGCYYIQGYVYARPMPADEYERLFETCIHETRLTRLRTLDNMDNNEFWNPKSMETLIFNSYVGGACIFEYHNGKTELLRTNEQYTHELGNFIPKDSSIKDSEIVKLLDEANQKILVDSINRAISNKEQTSCELCLSDSMLEHIEYVRGTFRVIARTDERYLFYCVVINITNQRIAEQKQRAAELKEMESAEQLKIIMSNINGGVAAVLIDVDTCTSKFIFSNRKYYELYGYTYDQAMMEKIDVISLIVPEDIPYVMSKIRQLKEDKNSVIIDYRCYRKDGRIAYLRANSSVMSMQGYGDEVITSVITDITEQKELMEQSTAIVNNINGGVTVTVLKEDEPEYIVVNNRFFEIFGYTREQYEQECKDKFSIIHPDDREEVKRIFKESVEKRKRYTLEYRAYSRDGKLKYLQSNISVTNIFGMDEPVQLSVTNDITKEMEANEKLMQLNELAHDLLAQPDCDIAMTTALNKILKIFCCARAYVVEMNYKENVSNNTYEVCADGVEREISNLQNIPFNGSETWYKTLLENKIVRIDSVDDLEDNEEKAMLKVQGITSLYLVPLWKDNNLIGFAGIDNPTESLNYLTKLSAIGDYVAILLTRRDMQREIYTTNKPI